MIERDDYPETLQEMAQTFTDVLKETGMPEAQADEVAWKVTEEFRRRWAGIQVYIPKGISLLHDEVWERYKRGEDINALAREYGISVQWINAIARKKRKKLQPSLFQTMEDQSNG